jgi:ubiquinone/menaquinone biosynthesis C-methylase UbiE
MNETAKANVDEQVVAGFGEEWTRFDQKRLPPDELHRTFSEYFAVFPWHMLPPGAVGFDLGCGTGRYANLVAPRVGHLHCIDASTAALAVARRNLAAHANCDFHLASVDHIPLEDQSLDFGYSLGVLHHIPDTAAGMRSCVRKLKRGAPFLVYLYYRFDNRPGWYKALWHLSEAFRRILSKMPGPLKFAISDILALCVYWPLSRIALLAEAAGVCADGLPLSYYRRRSLYTMRTDALDRFGTRLEQRFTRQEISEMMREAGLGQIRFSERAPFWCAVGIRD